MIIAIVISSVRLKLFQFKLECMRFLHNCAGTHVPPGVAVRPLKASSSAANAAIPTALSLERTGLENAVQQVFYAACQQAFLSVLCLTPLLRQKGNSLLKQFRLLCCILKSNMRLSLHFPFRIQLHFYKFCERSRNAVINGGSNRPVLLPVFQCVRGFCFNT